MSVRSYVSFMDLFWLILGEEKEDEKKLQNRGGLSQLRREDGASGEESPGSAGRHGELHDPKDVS